MFLIDENGKSHGKIQTSKALAMAEEAELDLVEISPQANPPVAKILDFGKFKYEQTKALQRQKAHRHESEVKEIRLGANIGDHDLEVKIKQAERFLKQRDKVKATIMFRGRQIVHADLGQKVLLSFIDRLQEIAKMEQAPTRQGRSMYIVISPK